jgi:hypothetical protein
MPQSPSLPWRSPMSRSGLKVSVISNLEEDPVSFYG